MTQSELAKSYLEKATKRLRVLDVLMEESAYSDVVREAQELVELALKGMLREIGIDPPKWHDVAPLLVEHSTKLPEPIRPHLARLAETSKWLRKEREFAFYGDIDFIPTEEYKKADGERALNDARFVVDKAKELIAPADRG